MDPMVKMHAPKDTKLMVRTPAPRFDSRRSRPNKAPTMREKIIRRANSVSCCVKNKSCGQRRWRCFQSSGKSTLGTWGTWDAGAEWFVPPLWICSLDACRVRKHASCNKKVDLIWILRTCKTIQMGQKELLLSHNLSMHSLKHCMSSKHLSLLGCNPIMFGLDSR